MKINNNDFENYLKMQKPHDSLESANEAINRFMNVIQESRNDLVIAEAHIIVKVRFLHNGDQVEAYSGGHFGNSLEAPAMCAWSIGQAEVERKANISKLLSGKNTVKAV